MTEIVKTFEDSAGMYVSPEVSVLLLHPEGVLCTSGDHEGFYPDGDYEIE